VHHSLELDAQPDLGRPGAVPSDGLIAVTVDHRLRTVGVWTNDGGRYRHKQAKQRCHQVSTRNRRIVPSCQGTTGNLVARRQPGRRRRGRRLGTEH
jgi:hypothetical protein